MRESYFYASKELFKKWTDLTELSNRYATGHDWVSVDVLRAIEDELLQVEAIVGLPQYQGCIMFKGKYPKARLFSKESFYEFVEENKTKLITMQSDALDDFWKNYPNGIVEIN